MSGWPAEFAARYRAVGHWRDQTFGRLTRHWADEYGPREALVDGEHRISYRQLAEHADALAIALREHGLQRGDRLLVQLPNCWELLVLLLACLRAGVAPVLALVAHREHELAYLARHAEVAMIVVPDHWRGHDHRQMAVDLVAGLDRPCLIGVVGSTRPGLLDLRALLAGSTGPRHVLDRDEPHPDDVAFFLLSGGTTGTPKMIGRTHNDYEYHVRRTAEICAVGPETAYLVTLPAAHNFPLCPGILGTLSKGGRVVLARSPEPVAAFDTIARERITMTSLVPAIAQRWVEAADARKPDLGSLRLIQVGGSVLEPGLARKIPAVLGGQLQQVYGMAEGLINYTRLDDPDHVVFATQGRPISPDDEVLVVDENDTPVPPGEVGELLTRGPYTIRSYFRAPDHNRKAFTPDGWYRTGDLVRWHPSGNLVVAGRRKDLINRGGEKISAEEVEDLVRKLLPVSAMAVVPVPDLTFGERVCLVVVPAAGRPALTLEAVRTALRSYGVAHYKLPEQLEVLDDLPLTPIGKVDKKALRARLSTRGSRADAHEIMTTMADARQQPER
ncbi:MAG TPA: AMP-binding protein [Amycolatopsis sp.]|uniref:(2,3-dihydroxybenzoyl)adenylate synthase n=1 Tax=Amycolatopsis sp. TaxID=37632 RepID=UPI002B47D989|nr:AMP-binding protein [Amycolatopsis sp.]HKS47647.1 AMP-binding protein [Amycolatopsis sp.]